jgi:PilZ domain
MNTTKNERRPGERVKLERGHPVQIMAIDGTWRRSCQMEDVSETGATLTVETSVEGLNLKEFFLLLSITGLAYRRCELSWVNGEQMGVSFLTRTARKKKPGGPGDRDRDH